MASMSPEEAKWRFDLSMQELKCFQNVRYAGDSLVPEGTLM